MTCPHSSTRPVHPHAPARIGHIRAVDVDVDAPARQREEVITMTSEPRHDGTVTPWADESGELGWHAVTASHGLAVAVAGATGGTVHDDGGQWRARIPAATVPAVATGADDRALWCRLGNETGSGVFTLPAAPWTPAELAACPLSDLPAAGKLSVRPVLLTTRMGRTVRYLSPAFTPA